VSRPENETGVAYPLDRRGWLLHFFPHVHGTAWGAVALPSGELRALPLDDMEVIGSAVATRESGVTFYLGDLVTW
jgi:hypothetical protein